MRFPVAVASRAAAAAAHVGRRLHACHLCCREIGLWPPPPSHQLALVHRCVGRLLLPLGLPFPPDNDAAQLRRRPRPRSPEARTVFPGSSRARVCGRVGLRLSDQRDRIRCLPRVVRSWLAGGSRREEPRPSPTEIYPPQNGARRLAICRLTGATRSPLGSIFRLQRARIAKMSLPTTFSRQLCHGPSHNDHTVQTLHTALGA